VAAKRGEPAICGPGFSYITCLRCKTSVCVKGSGSFTKLIYDIERLAAVSLLLLAP
jgi:hypothetical protein